MNNRLFLGDCADKLRNLDDNSIDSIVTDPPYGLSKEPNISEVLTKWVAGEPYDHGHGGFMGKSWDSFVPHPDIWREAYRVLKPGGYALVFAGTRTQDLMTIALRLAGFEVRDVIEWLYFSGFPKSMDVGKAFDNRAGWGTALKPAHEPIIVVRKPLIGTVANTVEKFGTGAINIDGCRIPSEEGTDTRRNSSGGDNGLVGSSTFKIRERRAEDSPEQTGRFPANCITTDDDAFYSPYFNVSPAELSKKASKRDRGEGNTHPTVKPTELMAWLVRLVTPPGGVVLDPFAGSGSTLVAAEREGFCFVGIERELEYIDIIKNRLQSKDVTIHDAGR